MNTIYTFFTGLALLFSNLLSGGHVNQIPVVDNHKVLSDVKNLDKNLSVNNEQVKSTSTDNDLNNTKVVVDKKDVTASGFRTIKLFDNEGKKAVLTSEDSSVVETVLLVLKDNKNVGWHLYDMNQVIISSGNAFISIGAPKGGCSEDDFIIDVKNRKIIDNFGGRCHYEATKNSIVMGNDTNGLFYYIYGSPSSVKIPNSILSGNRTYTAFNGPEGSTGVKVIATTTSSITFGIFDKTIGNMAPGDDTTYYKKVEERTFMIP